MKSLPQHIVAPDNCTGCSLCANVCSSNAISMVWSNEGFLIPEVNLEACVNCGLCVKRCPALQPKPVHHDDDISNVQAYGAWHRDEQIHMASSSGGVFTALAQQVIDAGGCVFGVVWQDKLTAAFAKAETMEEVAPMRGSKYTMAVPGSVYRDVRATLRTGRKVLFAGTPCQVHALTTYLSKPYENLLTIDIVCHGVPSRLLLEKYIRETERRTGKEVTHVSFREKRHSWQKFSQTKYFTDGSEEVSYLGEDEYMKLFLCDIALNRCCYNCRYSHFPRVGDISVADFWGVAQVHADWPIQKGISAVLANTPAGIGAMTQARDSLDAQEIPFSDIYQGQQVVYIRPPKPVHPLRGKFFADVERKSNKQLIHKYPESIWKGHFHVHPNSPLGWGYRVIRKLKRILFP